VLPFLFFRQYVSIRYLKNKEFRSKLEKNEKIKDYKREETLDIEKIYSNFYNYVYTIIINLAKGKLKEEDIEEVISDTFLVLWKNRNKLENHKEIKPYIAGITKNLGKEKIRKNKSYLKVIDYESEIDNLGGIDYIKEEREEIHKLKEIVEQLKKQDREIFEQYYYQAKKIKEIAKSFKLSEFTVKQKLYRIRKRIRKEMEKKGGYKNEK